MKHFFHEHLLILNENYDAKEGDVCRGCHEQMISCKSFVYSCSSISTNTSAVDNEFCVQFLIHKICAESPLMIKNPTNQTEFLHLFPKPPKSPRLRNNCIMCGIPWTGFSYCHFDYDDKRYVCLKCAIYKVQSLEDSKFEHPAHGQHPLALIQRPSSFRCDACNVEDNSKHLSYKCTKCQYWMHKSCGDAPISFPFQFHDKHPLILSFSLPRVYHKFDQYCRLCSKTMNRLNWLYYCPKCRFFAHFQCARSDQFLRSSENDIDDPDWVHLPAADEAGMDLFAEQFVKAMGPLNHNNSAIFSATNHITHGVHDDNRVQLITIGELNEKKDENDDISLICDICVKPIRSDDRNIIYSCAPCKYFLHKICTELPQEFKHHSLHKRLIAGKYREPYMCFDCSWCGLSSNGMFFRGASTYIQLHIGCATLPRMIQHEAHRHPLIQVDTFSNECSACGKDYNDYDLFMHRCEKCNFNICGRCIIMARTVKHRWDRHSLDLIYEAGMVSEHEHDFNCEFCSEDIDPNFWFYHCSLCDLSFHTNCFERSCYRYYSNIKFGASDIIVGKLHPHILTFVLNKRPRNCETCHSKQLGEPVLECTPCNVIFCRRCWNLDTRFKSINNT